MITTASRMIALKLLAVALTSLHLGFANAAQPESDDLIVHEWGTFTSVAGANGEPVVWFPLRAHNRLPPFVHTIAALPRGLPHAGPILSDPGGKSQLPATVRMETPVIYFYTHSPMTVSVQVDVPDGKITEWYPQADEIFVHDHNTGESIFWGQVSLSNDSTVPLVQEVDDNHYYAARSTDAAVVGVGQSGRVEHEKFLFYRGISFFDQPLQVELEGERLHLANASDAAIRGLLILHSDGQNISADLYGQLTDQITADRPRTLQTRSEVRAALAGLLMADGLFAKEAEAMIETWQHSWFSEGLRVLYLLPRAATDRALPLSIQPTPDQIERVMLGRVEVITPQQLQEVTELLEHLDSADLQVQSSARARLSQLGRFLIPMMNRILEDNPDEETARRIAAFLKQDGC